MLISKHLLESNLNSEYNEYISNFDSNYLEMITESTSTLDLYKRRYNNLKEKSDNQFNNVGVNTLFNNDIMQRLLNTNDKLIDELDDATTKKMKIEDKIHLSKLLQLNLFINN